MIPNSVTCEHCKRVDTCMEYGLRGLCQSFEIDFDKARADPALTRWAKAQEKRRKKEDIASAKRGIREANDYGKSFGLNAVFDGDDYGDRGGCTA